MDAHARPLIPRVSHRHAVTSTGKDVRVNGRLAPLTLGEKIRLLGGHDSLWGTLGVPKIGLPRRLMTDGPTGIHYHEGGKDSLHGVSGDHRCASPAAYGLCVRRRRTRSACLWDLQCIAPFLPTITVLPPFRRL